MTGPLGAIPRFDSLVDIMRWRAQRHPERRLYADLKDCEIQRTISYGAADRHARALAIRLREHAEVGDRALLLYPYSLQYPLVFLACLYAGIVAVPAYPPDPGRAKQTLPRVVSIARDAGARLILTTSELLDTVENSRLHDPTPGQREAIILATDALELSDPDRWALPDSLGDELAFLQYTSGSTRVPRGVMVGHRNLVEHQRLAHPVFARPEGNVTVSWLPFYHDMGLIGSLLYPLYSGGSTLLMSPTSFLRRPVNWLRAISRHRAGVSTGPNFAYDLCVRRSTKEDIASLDLSCWELTVCGAEPLRADTLHRFADHFAPCGFREETFLPCYGMAEATLMVTGGRVDRKPKTARFERAPLRRNIAVLNRNAEPQRAWTFVACGKPMEEHVIRIVDPETCVLRPEGEVGEIWLHGPSVGRGYWGRPEESERSFAAHLHGTDDDARSYMRTGDTGFLLGGELYVTGRLADLVLVGKRTHQPHDLERSAVAADPLIASSECAAFCVEKSRDEEPENTNLAPGVLIAVEVRRSRSAEELAEIARAVQERIAAEHGVSAHILLIPPRSVPKTSSGKIRRHAYRAALLDGSLELLHERRPLSA
jgi:acyl-CoA synthetase (AMP-forming)/AMP-acid ligase II